MNTGEWLLVSTWAVVIAFVVWRYIHAMRDD